MSAGHIVAAGLDRVAGRLETITAAEGRRLDRISWEGPRADRMRARVATVVGAARADAERLRDVARRLRGSA